MRCPHPVAGEVVCEKLCFCRDRLRPVCDYSIQLVGKVSTKALRPGRPCVEMLTAKRVKTRRFEWNHARGESPADV